MNILGVFLINEIRTGGDRRYIRLLELLAERGHRVFVIMNTFLDYAPRFVQPVYLSVKYKRRGFPPASFLFGKAVRDNFPVIKQALENAGFDRGVLHIHGDIYLKAALWLQKRLRLPFFYASRNDDIDRDRAFRRAGLFTPKEYVFPLLYENINRHRERQIAAHADRIAFLCNYEKDRFVERRPRAAAKTLVIPNSIFPTRDANQWRDTNHSKTVSKILYVGDLSYRKGFWDFLKTAALLIKRGYTGLGFTALGRMDNVGGSLRLMRALGLEGVVTLEGYRNPLPYYARHDLFVYPTPYEAFGNVLTEALHTGCPVIASAVGGIPELLADPDLLFPPGDVAAAADRIARCIDEPAFYLRLRQLCAERAEAHRFDWAGCFEAAMLNLL